MDLFSERSPCLRLYLWIFERTGYQSYL